MERTVGDRGPVKMHAHDEFCREKPRKAFSVGVNQGGRELAMHALSHDDWRLVCTHLTAPDIASLARTTRLFWVQQGADTEPLGRVLVQKAMKQHLEHRLSAIRPTGCRSLTLQDLFPNGSSCDAAGRPQVLLSGSMAVQAALGTEWRSDVDIFCTWEAAPTVRQWLVENCGLICSGANDTYDSRGPAQLTIIDHVEGYAPPPKVGSYELENRGWGTDRRTLTPEEYYAEACKYGNESVASGGRSRWGSPPKRVGLPGGSAGGVFPYNYDLENETFLQLIIGKEGAQDARELLESFDLTICKTAYDGRNFRIPAPLDTFCSRTRVTAARRALIEDFIQTEIMLMGDESENGDVMIYEIMEAMHDEAWEAVGLMGYSKAREEMRGRESMARVLASRRLDVDDGLDESDPPDDPNWMMRYIFVNKLILRLQKYAHRGVKIIAPPRYALGWQAQLSSPHGDFTAVGKPLRDNLELYMTDGSDDGASSADDSE